MTLQIYWASGSAFSWRVLLALELKGVPYESKLIQLSQREQRSPAYLAMNPRGRVPVLRDGDHVVYESVACLAYLERRHPAPPLFGGDAQETGRIWRLVCESLAYLDDPVEEVILPLYFGRHEEKRDQIARAAPRVHDELQRLEAALAQHPWLAGTPGPSAAECVIYPFVRSLERAEGKPAAAGFDLPFSPLRQKLPAVAAWMARVEALPGYERTFPPHWRG